MTESEAARSKREASFKQWWNLALHNDTAPHGRENLAREAYYAAWGGSCPTCSVPRPNGGTHD